MKATRVLAFEGTPAMGWSEFEYRFSIAGNDWTRIDQSNESSASNGTGFLEGYAGVGDQTLEHVDGLEFDLLELDVAEYVPSGVALTPVHFEGTKGDGTVLVLDVPLDGVADGTGPEADFQKVVFPAEWTDLVKVRIPSSGWAIDNVKVRGFAVENAHESVGDLPVPLQVLGTLENNARGDYWKVREFRGSKLMVHNQYFTNKAEGIGLFDPATGQTTHMGAVAEDSGGNPLTGESTFRSSNGALLLLPAGGGTQKTVAQVGQNGVDGINYPTVSNGKVIFASAGYKGVHVAFTVFMASSTGVSPYLAPGTVLADGGTLLSSEHSRPEEMHFLGNTIAIPASTTKTGDCFLASFDGGPLRIGPGVGKFVPGTNYKITERRELLWLDDSSLGYLVRSGGAEARLHIITMLANGTSSAASGDILLSSSIIPGSGMLQRTYEPAGVDRSSGIFFATGPLECRAVAPNNLSGIVARAPDGSRRVLVREGSVVPGFGELKSFTPYVTAANGEFYFTAVNEAGTVAVLKGQVPQAIPQLKTGDFVDTADGSVRFMVENLTLGQAYRVEGAPSPAGPWSERSHFTGGSRSRSVFGAFERGTREFFRVVVE